MQKTTVVKSKQTRRIITKRTILSKRPNIQK